MTRVAENGVIFVAEEPDGRCELCGAVEETRPYGPNGEEICFSCGQKNLETTKQKFQEFMDSALESG